MYVIAVAIVVAAGVWWFVTRPSPAPAPAPRGTLQKIESSKDAGLGGQIYRRTQANPAAGMPDVNPLKAQVNPYEGAYQNPFGQ